MGNPLAESIASLLQSLLLDGYMTIKTRSTPSENAVVMQGIWKYFPGIAANQGVDFTLRNHEIHALLGENGAGKTTLMRILAGEYILDAGKIWIDGKDVDFKSPADAIAEGIGMVHQHFRLVPDLSVAENILLGSRSIPLLVGKTELQDQTLMLSSEYGIHVKPDELVQNLSVGEQQKVEILKVLSKGAKILLLDEPTAVLTPQEADDLFAVMEQMTSRGCQIVFISHKLDEVLRISNRVTVLRQGCVVGTCQTQDCTSRSLARMMVGEDSAVKSYRMEGKPSDEVVLSLKDVSAHDNLGRLALKGIDLTVYKGEILGIAGVSGNGQTELAEVIGGIRKLKSGTIEYAGKDYTDCGARGMAEAGVGHIPEERLGVGLVPSMSVMENSILRNYNHPPIRKGLSLNMNQARKFAESLCRRSSVQVPSTQVLVQNLSGGNQQKLLAEREIENASRLLIAVHPTRGLDVAATAYLRGKITDHRNRGGAVILISEDLDEIIEIADRIAVMYEGKIIGEMNSDLAHREELGLLMGGSESTMESAR